MTSIKNKDLKFKERFVNNLDLNSTTSPIKSDGPSKFPQRVVNKVLTNHVVLKKKNRRS